MDSVLSFVNIKFSLCKIAILWNNIPKFCMIAHFILNLVAQLSITQAVNSPGWGMGGIHVNVKQR